MGDLQNHGNLFTNYKGGTPPDEYDDMALDTTSDETFFTGGIKDEEKSSYTVTHVSDGTFEGGYYISATPGGAAKKAATSIYRHIDMETGVRPPSKSDKRIPVPINTALAKFYNKRNPISEISFVILRIDRNDLRKYFAYNAVREHIDPIPVYYKDANGKKLAKPIMITSKITVTKGTLDEELVQENKKFQKVKAAKVRAVKDKEEGKKPARKPRAPKGEAKPKKAASAKKATPKKSTKNGAPTLADIVKALSSSPSEVKPKKSAKKSAAKKSAAKKSAAKKPAAKKPAAKKSAAKKSAKKSGGGFCSFF